MPFHARNISGNLYLLTPEKDNTMAKEERSLSERLSGLSPDQLKALLRKGRDEAAPRIGKPAKMERNPEETYPLSKAQERMWFLHNLTEGEAIYNNPVALRITAVFPLDTDIMSRSLGMLAERHEILRTTFHVKEGNPVQRVHPSGNTEISFEDLRLLAEDEREKRAMEEAVAHGKILIPLDRLPLLRFRVLRLRDLEYLLLINPHHIISDGWSNALFAKELSMTYAALEHNQPPPFPVPEYQYADFVKWEKEWMNAPQYQEQLAFWKEQLAGLPEPLRLPFDFPRPAQMSHRGSKEADTLGAAETETIRQFCQQENLTLFQLLFGSFALLLSNYSGQKDIMVGVPVARRNQIAFQQTMGLFINTLPLRVKINEGVTGSEYLKEIRNYCQQAFNRQELPFEKLIEEVNPDRNLSTNPLFQVHFVHQNIPSLYSVSGLTVKPESIDYSYSKFDLNFWVEEANHELILSVTYPRDIFLPETVRKLLLNYKILLRSLIRHPMEPVCLLEYFPLREGSSCNGKTAVFTEEGTTFPMTWLHEFRKQAQLTPGRMAVRDRAQRLTYRELDVASGHLADVLEQHHVVKGDRVGLLLPRDASLIVSILGLFRAGAAYVPLDVNLPEERMRFIAADAGLKLIISNSGLSASAGPAQVPVLCFHEIMYEPETPGFIENPGTGAPGDPAYVIYTSGTTGTPKGVCVEFDQLLNYSKTAWQRMNLLEGDSFATISSISADLGNTMIFPPLIHGGEVVVIPEDHATDASLLAEWLEREPVDCLKIVPSHLQSLLHSGRAGKLLPRKLLVLGGEKCLPGIVELARDLSQGLRIINHYGPTEATIGSLTYEIPSHPDSGTSGFPIGFPLDNTSVYILDPQHRLLPKGVAGEIVLSGRNISPGYLNQPDLTQEKFSVDRFRPGERIYFTGDHGKMNGDGSVTFLGRIDHQLKIRGYRVETREIENVLNRFPSVEQSVVLIPDDPEPVSAVGVAVMVRPGATYDEQELRRWLSCRLPSYMIPSFIQVLDSFPVNTNGKISMKELTRMVKPSGERQNKVLLPRDLTELMLVNIFRDILSQSEVSIDQGFFDLGGHSLLAIQLFAAIEKAFGIHLPLATLFEHGSVMALAGVIRKSSGSLQTKSLVPVRPGNGKKQLYLVHPAGGNVLCYYELARELGKEYTIYGLQSAGLYGKEVNTVSDMAALYLEEISLPAGIDDVIFAGWSMGALIAFEMARQVGERSGVHPGLMIIDQLAPVEESACPEEKITDPVGRLMVFSGKVAQLVGRPLGIREEELRGRSPEEHSESFLEAFRSVGLVPPDMPLRDFHGYLELMIRHNEITAACRPGTFEGKTLLIRAGEQLPPAGNRPPQERTSDLNWGRWIKGDLTIENIPGNHVTIITQPCVRNLALALEKWVDSCSPETENEKYDG